jgi:hypothetical protein
LENPSRAEIEMARGEGREEEGGRREGREKGESDSERDEGGGREESEVSWVSLPF